MGVGWTTSRGENSVTFSMFLVSSHRSAPSSGSRPGMSMGEFLAVARGLCGVTSDGVVAHHHSKFGVLFCVWKYSPQRWNSVGVQSIVPVVSCVLYGMLQVYFVDSEPVVLFQPSPLSVTAVRKVPLVSHFVVFLTLFLSWGRRNSPVFHALLWLAQPCGQHWGGTDPYTETRLESLRSK